MPTLITNERNVVHASPIQYLLGQIPSQTAWYGHSLEFDVAVNSKIPDWAFSIQVSQQPKGSISIDSATGKFKYVPSPEDKGKFDVTFIALSTRGRLSQTITITHNFTPEYSFINNSRELPDEGSREYIQITEVKHPELEAFNSNEDKRHRRSISISGKTILFEKGTKKNDLYGLYNEKDDIRSMSIFAETLVIASPLRLPQTDVTIYAKNLVFKDSSDARAVIDTTPSGTWKIKEAVTDTHPKADHGETGNNAGNITLHIGNFFEDSVIKLPRIPPGIRFIMNGGAGQRGSVGINGQDGSNLPPQQGMAGGGPNVVWVEHGRGDNPNTPFETWGTKIFPSDGTPATADGIPGDGGKGGNISSNIILPSGVVQQSGGQSAPAGELKKGGKPGTPNPAIWMKHLFIRKCTGGHQEPRDCTDIEKDEEIARRTSTGFPDLPAPSADHATGSPGSIVVKPSKSGELDWLHPSTLQAVITYCKDLYLNGHLDAAQTILKDYYAMLTPDANQPLPEEFTLQFEVQRLEIEALLHRLSSNLDYFGNPAGYVPMLSLQSNFLAYKNEVDSAIPILYMTYWLGQKSDALEAKKAALNEGIRQLQLDIEKSKEEYNIRQKRIGDFQGHINSILSHTQVIQMQLKEVEVRLEGRAAANVNDQKKLPGWKTALRTLATVSKIVPVYQPALGAIGTGLDVISSIDTNSPIESFNQLSNVADQLNKANLEKSSKNLSSQLSLCDPKNAANAKDCVKSILPLAKEVAKAQRAVRESTAASQASQSEIEVELRKIKNSDPEFESLVALIEELNIEKESFSRMAAQDLQSIASLSEGIANNLLAIDAMNEELRSDMTSVSPATARYIKEVELRAKERLLKYQYYLAKAYEYRVGEEYFGKLDLNSQFTNLINLASADPVIRDVSNTNTHPVVLTEAEFSRLRFVYEEPLRRIVDMIITRYNQSRPERSDKFNYNLTQNELSQLNTRGEVAINLQRAGMILPTEENQRIFEITTSDLQAHLGDADRQPVNAGVKVTYEQPGRSLVRSGNKAYIFNFTTPFSWGTSLDLINRGKLVEEKTSLDSQSLLRTLLTDTNSKVDMNNVLLFSEPSLLGDIIIRKEERPGNIKVVIDHLSLKFTYDFYRKSTKLVTLDVQVPEGMSPYIACDATDITGLTDGRGDFIRTYPRDSSVQLKAEPTYGDQRFVEWREGGRWEGKDLVGGTSIGTDPSITINLSSHKVIRAIYKRADN